MASAVSIAASKLLRGGRVFDRVADSVKLFCPTDDGLSVWAPDIIKLNGEYYLYYSISSWGQFVSAVGLLSNPTLDVNSPNYHWTDRGMVVHFSEGEDLNAIDPDVCLAPDGSLWLCHGSYHGNIELVEPDPKTGLRIATNSPATIIANQSAASDIIFHDGYFYKWIIAPAGGGFYKITSAAGGIVLAATDKTAIIAPFTGDDSQLWKLDQLADGSYCIASKAGEPALTATVKMKPGDDVTLEKYSGNNSQRWLVAAP